MASKIANCVTCRELRGTVQEQKMSDLPEDRHPHLRTALSTAVVPDIFKEGRKEVKRYVALFTCMASRAVHLEVSNTLETVSFHNASRRFICRRVPVRQLRSDQGTNFIGANFIGAKRGILSHADLRDRSDCEQPPANSGQPKRPKSTSPLTPNHILTVKTKPVLPPPGIFQREGLYLR